MAKQQSLKKVKIVPAKAKKSKLKPQSSISDWIGLRYEITRRLQGHVHALLGGQSQAFDRYEKEYKKEIHRSWKASDRNQLLTQVEKSSIVFMGDFHALKQSQKAHLRILKSLPDLNFDFDKLILCIECIEQRFQHVLDQYLMGNLSDRDFLKSVEWKRNWGFPWDHYRPLFRWAQKNKIKIFALNSRTSDSSAKSLHQRDRLAAEVVHQVYKKNLDHKIFVIYGDLHIASKHLPAILFRKNASLKKKSLQIFQNSEGVYFQMLKKEIEHQVDVVRFSQNQFCLQNVPPWVKWQNYLLFLEKQSDRGFDEDLDLTDHVAAYLRVINHDLGFEASAEQFTLLSLNDREMWVRLQNDLRGNDLLLVQDWIEKDRSFYIPQTYQAYLGRSSVNSAAQLAMLIFYSQLSQQKKIPSQMPQDFHALIWLEAIQYLGSKLINPKRKTDTLADIKSAAAGSAFEKEVLQLALSQKMAEVSFSAQRSRGRHVFKPRRQKVYYQAARILGGMMGEKIYYAYRKKMISQSNLLKLLRQSINDEAFSQRYWELVDLVEGMPEPFLSKKEKL